MLRDKFYADFRSSYFFGLRRLLEALAPATYTRYTDNFVRREGIERDRTWFEQVLGTGNLEEFIGGLQIMDTLLSHSSVGCGVFPK